MTDDQRPDQATDDADDADDADDDTPAVAYDHGTYEPLGLPSGYLLGSVSTYGYTYDAVGEGGLAWTPSPLPPEPDATLLALLAQCRRSR